MHAVGLQTHIWNNNLKSAALLAGFPLLLILLLFAGHLLLIGVLNSGPATLDEAAALALKQTGQRWPYALIAAACWFTIAYFFYDRMIRAATGARPVTREQETKLYNLLENLCISRGLATPKLAIIETDALNAFASGLDRKSYTVTLTRGLIDGLERRELEAVIAHELTHIENRDVRLLVITIIFVGVFSFFAEIVGRNLFRTGYRVSRTPTPRRNDNGRGGGLIILIAVVLVFLAYALALVLRFSLSRKREYLADAGAVELTRNPDAMISALQKISGRAHFETPGDVADMFIENEVRFMGVFATHPPIEARIDALKHFASGHD